MELGLTIQGVVEPRFLDAMGHMNVAWYVHLFDRGVWDYFERTGLDAEYLQRKQRGMFALEETIRYLSELREGDALEVRTGALEVRPKTLRLLQHMVDSGRQRVAAVCEVVAVHIDLSTRRSIEFEPAVLARLQAAPQAVPGEGALSEASAQSFARAWIDAWNRRDVEAVLSHYAEDAVFVSPKAERFVGTGRMEGKAALRAYWQTALSHISSLRFTLDAAFWSPRTETLTVLYDAKFGEAAPVRAVEIMRFRGGKIAQGEGLYGATVAP
ncbi:MAG TPA: thioesterase family protein [Polyangiaceae bacterium]|nr:thioesterase family protein [Polyangiaceae bacterium]